MFKEGILLLKQAIRVAVNNADLPVDAHKGRLLMITPEEQAHALLLKVAYDVFQGGQEPHTMDVGALECASLRRCDRE